MRQLLAEYLAAISTQQGVANRPEQVGMARKTWTTYGSHISLFFGWLETRLNRPVTPDDFTLANLLTYNNARRKAEIKQRTRAAQVCALKSFARWLAAQGTIGAPSLTEILTEFRVRVTDPARRPCATDAQVMALFAACDRLPDTRPYRRHLCAAVLACMAYAGLRRSEVCALAYDGPRDIILDDPTPSLIVRHGKGDKMREVPLNAEAVRLLRRWLEFRPEGIPDLFAVPIVRIATGPDIVPLGDNRLLGILRELCEIAGVPWLVPHSFRRFFATRLLEIPGCTIKDVQLALGHTDPVTTWKYINSPDGKLRKLIAQTGPKAPDPAPIAPAAPPARRRTDKPRRRDDTITPFRKAAFRRQ